MKKIAYVVLLIMMPVGIALAAPSPIARFKYEDAEAAFAKQDYQTALKKLDEAEQEFGKINPPILHLRIMTRHELVKGARGLDFDNLESLQAETRQYMKEYGNLDAVRDQVREVYRVMEELRQYPTRKEHQSRLDAEARARQAEAEETRKRIEELQRTCPLCFPEMVAIPGKGYEIGKYEVTQGQWEAIMGSNPSVYRGDDNRPVESVSWDDVQRYLESLNKLVGKQYRLPTEDEWETACYAGRQTTYCGGDNVKAVAWWRGMFFLNDSDQPIAVGQKQPNGFGLHDMTGNVAEWVEDCYEESCANRAIRGGSFAEPGTRRLMADNRMAAERKSRYPSVGFRIARTLTSE